MTLFLIFDNITNCKLIEKGISRDEASQSTVQAYVATQVTGKQQLWTYLVESTMAFDKFRGYEIPCFRLI